MKKSFGSKALFYPSPVWCVGTYDKNEKSNVMTASWGGICCSKPPAVTISLRKATYTYKDIMETKAYTISVPSKNQTQEADYFGLKKIGGPQLELRHRPSRYRGSERPPTPELKV